MPVVTESKIGGLLADGTITAFTIDTNVVIGKGGRVRLDAHLGKQIETLIEHPLPLVLTCTVVREIVACLTDETEGNISAIKSALNRARHVLKISETARDHWINEISGGREAQQSAQESFDAAANAWGYELLDDERYITGYSLFDDYFDGKLPFGPGRDKCEFLDSLILKTLNATAEERQTYFLVVSSDKRGWKKFCEKSARLYWVEDMGSALSCLAHATAKPADETTLKQAVITWLAEDNTVQREIETWLADAVEEVQSTDLGLPGEGPSQFQDIYGDKLISPQYAPLDEITIAHQDVRDGVERATIHVPLSLSAYVPSVDPTQETLDPAPHLETVTLVRHVFSVRAVIRVRTPYPRDDTLLLDEDTATILEIRPIPER